MKELQIKEEFAITVKEFFELFFSNEKFKLEFHQKRGDTEITFTSWTPTTEPNKFERSFKFLSPTSSSAMIRRVAGATVQVIDTEYYSFQSDNELHVETTTQVSGSMASSFGTWIKWNIQEVASSRCNITLLIQNEYKGSLMKGTIEDFIHEASKTAFQIYLDMARTRVKEYIKERTERVESQKHIRAPTPERPDHKLQLSETHPALPSPVRSPRPKTEEPRAASLRKQTITSDSDDEEFFDVEDWPDEIPATRAPMSGDVALQLERLKNVLDVTHSRLQTLESAFTSMQERMSIMKSKSNLTVAQSNTIQVMSDTISNYYKRLELIAKDRLEQEQRAKEREEALERKLEEVANRMSRFQPTPTTTFGKGVALGIILIVWPIVASHAWKFVTQFVLTKMARK